MPDSALTVVRGKDVSLSSHSSDDSLQDVYAKLYEEAYLVPNGGKGFNYVMGDLTQMGRYSKPPLPGTLNPLSQVL